MPKLSILTKQSGWTLFSSGLFILFQAVQIVIVSHYISKESFGYLSISNSFVFLCIALVETGLALSIIQSTVINDSQVKAILNFNIKLSLYLSIGLIPIAFFLQYLYNAAAILEITFYMIPVIILVAYNSVFISRIKRELNFKRLSIIEITSFAVSFIVVIILAMEGMEFMSIVYGYWARHFMLFFLLKSFGETSLDIQTGKDNSLDYQHNFSKYVYGEKLLTSILSNADALIIGKVIGMTDLGVYDVFKKVILRPILLLYNSVEGVAFSILSKIINSDSKYKKTYRNFVFSINWIGFTIIGVLFINTDFILSFFPESYYGYSSSFKYFCLFITSILLLNPLDLLLYSQGKSKQFLRWMVAYTLPLILSILLSSFYGLNTLLLVMSIFYLALYILAYFMLVKPNTNFSAYDYFAFSLLSLITISLLVYILVYYFNIYSLQIITQLLISILVFSIFLSIVFIVSYKNQIPD